MPSLRWSPAVAALALVAVACAPERNVPLDAPSLTTVPATETTLPEGASAEVSGHINAEGVDMGLQFARQKCLDDPLLDEGVVMMADEVTGDVVAEFRQQCSAVRP